ncbi:MAG: isoprenylcysteine carboxylmethyltransferase family protein [Desulfobacteraceae bacterium]|jgi:protein-S-isoprenylcysteine O-methyltransferase Ste14|nr:isoprenylcysteine carboxylmethyltransferase family protein [Desulfobacteraceae bacterium]MDH3880639.1 isoprenylcysteine carboxylmethyltransferase family protein [Desulfobacteraceae bacterium]
MNQFFNNPFFWALISMFTLVGACSVVGSRKIGRHPALGWIMVTFLSLGRVILVLPSVDQPRFFLNGFNAAIGIPIFVIGLCFALGPCFLIRPLNIAEEDMEFITKSFYKYTRNPIYLGEILWCLGWSIIHGSIIGVVLVPVWWSGFLFLILIEEESLQRAIGTKYVDYKNKVKGRIIPGTPI